MEPHATSLGAPSDISAGENSTQRKGKIRQWMKDIDLIDNATAPSSVAGGDLSST